MYRFFIPAIFLALSTSSYGKDYNKLTENNEYQISLGQYENQQRLAISYRSGPIWSKHFGSSSLQFILEPEIAYWKTKQNLNASNQELWQFSMNPMLTWQFINRWYLEAGIGLTYLSEKNFDDKKIGSKLNFSDNIGLGYQINKNNSIGYRYSHYSNASIKKPNPGLDMHQIVFRVTF